MNEIYHNFNKPIPCEYIPPKDVPMEAVRAQMIKMADDQNGR